MGKYIDDMRKLLDNQENIIVRRLIYGINRKIMQQIRAGKRHGNNKRQTRENIERMDRSDTISRMEMNTW